MLETIWVDYEEREVYTDVEQVDELIANYKQSRNYDYNEEFRCYLEEYYSTMQIFNFTDNEKSNIEQEFNESIRKDILERLDIVEYHLEF